MIRVFISFFCLLIVLQATAQRPTRQIGDLIRSNDGKIGNTGNNNQKGKASKDSLDFKHRDPNEDSLTLHWNYIDSLEKHSIDSSINDYDVFAPVPSTWNALGNNGLAAYPLLFSPNRKAGFDAGFHAFDLYKLTLANTKLYNTTRPFTTLGYMVGPGKEQVVNASHTQNTRPNLNWGLDYKLISSPGLFVTQNTNHSSYRLFGNFKSKKKRYSAILIFVGNYQRASENGGIQNDSFLLDPNKKKRFAIPVNLGNTSGYTPNPFQTTVYTGNTYKDQNFFLRQSYDIGKRDSVKINDSTTEYLFYPKLRLQHNFTYTKESYLFKDVAGDSTVYANWYGISLNAARDTFSVGEQWKIFRNDFSLYQYPNIKNLSQYLSVGATLENIQGSLAGGKRNFFNTILHGDYKMISRSKLWDINLHGEFYAVGFNFGNYAINANLSRFISPKLGFVHFFFYNINRSPSFIFDKRSSFALGNAQDFSNENILSFGAKASTSFGELGFANHIVNNYLYYSGYNKPQQYTSPISVAQFTLAKKVKLTKRINWYFDGALQLKTENMPVSVPLIYTRSRLAYEGNFYKNLFLSTGLEVRYYTPYNANGYSPVKGQFILQDTTIISNRPDVCAYLNFRIRSFTAFIRAENLNTVSFNDGFGFLKNNLAAPLYPMPGFAFRLGIRWWFVN